MAGDIGIRPDLPSLILHFYSSSFLCMGQSMLVSDSVQILRRQCYLEYSGTSIKQVLFVPFQIFCCDGMKYSLVLLWQTSDIWKSDLNFISWPTCKTKFWTQQFKPKQQNYVKSNKLNNIDDNFSHNRYSKIMTNLWNEISDSADLNRDGAVTLQELQVKMQTDRQIYKHK